MKFCELLNDIIVKCSCTASDLCSGSDISPSTLRRYRSGERVPSADSKTLAALTAAIASIAEEKNIPGLDEKTVMTQILACDDILSTRIEDLLYHFDTLLILLSVSTSRLSQKINYDASTISRFRSGQRQPAEPLKFAKDVADIIAQISGQPEDLAVLAKLLACSEETLINEKDRAERINHWILYGPARTENTISTFLSKIDDFDLNEYIKAIHFDEMKVPTVPFQIPSSRTCFGLKEMMEAEMDDHLGYEKSERSDNDDYRNGYKRKQVNSRYGSMEIEVPQDRKSTFEPQVVKKRQKDISDIDQKIISMYAKGMTTRQISETIEDIYGFETSESFISDVTDKILPQIEDWQNRPLDEVYPILYIDAIHYSVRDNGVIRKLAAYVILGINTEGKKEVLTISVGDNESAKYWLSVMNELKNRGVKDVLVICADGLTGIKEAIAAAFPKTEYQRCIVHQVRNTLKYVPDKDRKAFATDLKTIYQASDEKKALAALDRVTEKWAPKYPNSMKRWKDNWDAISPIFKFSATVRKVIYTTNAIESLNSTYRKLNRQRSVFPSDTALLKALYLATFEATKKWTSTIRNWAQVYGELSIMYEGRLPE